MAMQGPNIDVKDEKEIASEVSDSNPSLETENLSASTIGFEAPKYTSGFLRFFGAKPSEAEIEQAKKLFKYEKEAKRLAEEWEAQHPSLNEEQAAELQSQKARERTEFDGSSVEGTYDDAINKLSIMLAEKASMRDVAIEASVKLGLGTKPVQGPEQQPMPTAMSQFGPTNSSSTTQLFHAKLQQGLQTRLNAKLTPKQVSKLDLDDRNAVNTFKKVVSI